MSDFVNEGWAIYVAVITVISILACGVLLQSMSTRRPAGDQKVGDTGHVWDEDLVESNNPLPRWWMWLFWLTIVFALVYLALYPGLGSYKGYLDWSSRGQYQAEQQQADATYGPLIAKFVAQDVVTVAANVEARDMGQRLFLNYCAQCHGSDAGGSRGFPSLRDRDWLYGGDPAAIHASIASGRNGVMPPMDVALGSAEAVRDTAQYVLKLSGRTFDSLRAFRGKQKFDATCAACHGVDGKGNLQLGAPNLTDDVWLHGGSEASIIESISRGRTGAMPAHKDFLDAGKIHLLTAYIYGLSTPPEMTTPARKSTLAAVSTPVDTALYELRQKIYPRAVHGWFANWRIAMVVITQVIFYGLPWLTWNGRQAVLFDLAARKFYIFGAVFWPQDFIFLTALLIISALALFLFTTVAGRLFCGYACPQTVYTEIFLWVERLVEGDRARRMRLDKSPLSARKVGLKALKHGIWIAIAAWTGFTFVGYFTPVHTLLGEVVTLSMGPWETFWVLFYGFATYGNAGWMREQVCKYMCPYARFQSVMFDRDTLVITYDEQRGEPRGSRARAADYKTAGLGACVDCGICVQVCPTGIDIRNGLQYECIGCAACIDGCDQVMDKMGYARGLIRYSTENAVAGAAPEASLLRRVLRPRVLVYSALLTVVVGAFLAGLYLRSPLSVDVIRDRAALARDTRDGLVENVYRLQIMNADERPRRYLVRASGVAGLTVVAKQPIEVAGATTHGAALALRADPAQVKAGWHDIVITIEDADRPEVQAEAASRFYVR